MRILIIAGISLAVCGCTTVRRSSASGYEARNERVFSLDRQAGYRDESVAVKRAEAALEGRREREQYFKNKPYLRTDREKLEFLSLDSYEARERWMNAHGVFGTATPHSSETQALIDVNDITVGMTKQAVRDSWGEPELVEVAGNPIYGNERWAYSEQLPGADGYQTEKRTIYFEGGRVVGWERK